MRKVDKINSFSDVPRNPMIASALRETKTLPEHSAWLNQAAAYLRGITAILS